MEIRNVFTQKPNAQPEAERIARSPLVRSIWIFGGLLIVAVLTINAWSLSQSWQRMIRNAEDTAINLSLSQARQAEDTFLQTEITLRELQRDLQSNIAAGAQGSRLSLTMRDLKSRLPQLHGLFFYDASGKWIATSAQPVPVGINNSDRDYFVYHRNNPRNSVHIGPVIRSRSTGELVIPVSMRVTSAGGGFGGVLLATIKVDYFRHYYGYYEMGNSDVLVLMLADSTVLYARPMPDSYIGKNLSSSCLFREMLMKSDRGSGQWSAALDGKKRIFGFARSERYPLVVAAGYDKQSLIKQWMKSRVQDVTLNLALLAGILIMIFFILRQARMNLRYQAELTQLRDELTLVNNSLKSMAMIDGLTGLANRRQFDLYLHECLMRSAVNGEPVSLLMIDVDYFKRYNDTYGHTNGDECLRRLGDTLSKMPHRSADLVARYGGEEFAIILPNTQQKDALRVAMRAVETVRSLSISHQTTDVPAGIVTISAGCATITASGKEKDVQQLLTHADAALYRAKHHGRNRVAL
ncbi:sensor domain-containing diguanylate cyclase [Pantoea sp. T14]|uniref:sensor domain-containing diguanylate cyclase n=1 Tax=Pantoea sp. T14 TaxID=3085685 RepID=UPI002FCC2A35